TNAGMHERTTPQVVSYFEKIFAKYLRGHSLLTNKSEWRNFPTIQNAHWYYENVVLMGDAARTAHFSIGSGTKLAMEDAIALANALQQNPSLGAALSAYETERRDISARTQRAAQDSLMLFENVKRYYGRQSPLQFTFNLMTRSKRITYDNLKLRDPELVRRVTEEWNRERRQPDVTRPPMFSPFSLKG